MSETIKSNSEQDPNAGSEWDILENLDDEPGADQDQTDVETEASAEQEHDPRVESLAIPLARDYAEKNYPKLEDGTFKPAWRGKNGEKAYKNKSPEDLVQEGAFATIEEASAAVVDIANTPYDQYSE